MKFVAVASCPTGIAHSQMAAANLEQVANTNGHEIDVEIQGAMGQENELSADAIDAADAVIIAADTSVSRDGFDDRPLIKGTVKDAVNDAEGLIERAIEAAANGGESSADVGDGTLEGLDTEASSDGPEKTVRRGGDPSKGLFARLERLFS
jgi:fructose PTS system EIIB component